MGDHKKYLLHPLLVIILAWGLLAPIGITFLGRWRGGNRLAGGYLLASAGGATKVKSDSLAYLKGETDKGFVEFPCLVYTIKSSLEVEEDYVRIHIGAFFGLGLRFGFIIYDETPAKIDPLYAPIWEYVEGVYLYGY